MPRCRKPFIICWNDKIPEYGKGGRETSGVSRCETGKTSSRPAGERKNGMDRVNRILCSPRYLECVEKTRKWETDRIFCRHDMAHFLDVARLSWMENLEKGLGIEKELIYAAALLHDCGRFQQYEDGTPHELAGAKLAEGILSDCGFQEAEREEILQAIAGHRDKTLAQEESLRGILYRADKRSRACFACPSEKACSWPDSKKNLRLER